MTWVAETDDGRVLAGMLVEKTDEVVALRDVQGVVHTVDVEAIQQLLPQQKSMMPELLAQDSTAQQLADLIE